MRLLFALFASAGMALATGFDGTWDATILAGGDLVPFRLEVSESPARVCFFEDTQPVCSTAQPQYPGLDQINVLLPPSLAGAGDVVIQVTVDGQAANPGHVTIRSEEHTSELQS